MNLIRPSRFFGGSRFYTQQVLCYFSRLAVGVCFLVLVASAQQPCSIERIAGGGSIITGAGRPATQAEILDPADARVGPDGLLYIADRGQDVIWRVLGDETIELFAGTGASGASGDEGPATQALLDGPESLAFGPDGSLFVFSGGDFLIRRIDAGGVIHAHAGSGAAIGTGTQYEPGMTASQMPLGFGTRIAVGPSGEVYATLPGQNRVVRINSDGEVLPIAGGGADGKQAGSTGDGGPAADALLAGPADVAADSAGNLYIADQRNNRIRLIDTNGIIQSLDAAASLYQLQMVREVEVDAADVVYWIDQDAVRRLPAPGAPETYPLAVGNGFSLGPAGEVYSFSQGQVRRQSPGDAAPTHIAGVGWAAAFGNGGPALNARFVSPRGLAVGPGGEVFVVDDDSNRVRIVRMNGAIDAFAGTGTAGFSGDGGPASAAELHRPSDVTVGPNGDLFIADWLNSRIRRVDAGGMISTFAGNGLPGCVHDFDTNECGDGGPAVDGVVPRPIQIDAGPDGSLHILDSNSSRRVFGPGPRDWLRRISPEGILETAPFLSLDAGGNLAQARHLAAKLDGGSLAFADGPASLQDEKYIAADYAEPEASTSLVSNLNDYLSRPPNALSYGADGSLYAAVGAMLLRVSPDGNVNTLVGSGGFPTGAPVPLTLDGYQAIADVAVGPDGDLYLLADNRVYRLSQPASCDLSPKPEIAVEGIRHGATYEGPAGPSFPARVAPGQIVNIFGRRLGPEELAGGQISGGFVTTETGGVRVLVDGQPAPMLFASAGQLGAIIPYGTSSEGAVPLQVEVDGVLSEPRQVQLSLARPGIFTLDSSGQGPGAILNQNGSLNTAANPARPGEVIVLWATGEGQTNPPGVDGRIANGALPQPVQSVEATIGLVDATVLYAGAGPGMVAGVMQVNLLVPEGLVAGAQVLNLEVGQFSFGSFVAQSVTVFVAP